MAEIEPLGFRSYFISIPTQFQDIALNIINFEDPATPKLISNGVQRCLLHRESGWKTGPNEPDSMCEPGPDGFY
uniref:Uncharacterized protein n=1 Tax=Acrobeloides nanus TaxID=290746 RepID=A0A914D6J8_9BILA